MIKGRVSFAQPFLQLPGLRAARTLEPDAWIQILPPPPPGWLTPDDLCKCSGLHFLLFKRRDDSDAPLPHAWVLPFSFLFPYNVPTVFRLEVGNPDLSSEPSRHLVAQHTLAQTLVRATVHLEGLAGVLRGDGWDAELDEEQPSRSRPPHPCVLTQREARGPLPGRESRARKCCD